MVEIQLPPGVSPGRKDRLLVGGKAVRNAILLCRQRGRQHRPRTGVVSLRGHQARFYRAAILVEISHFPGAQGTQAIVDSGSAENGNGIPGLPGGLAVLSNGDTGRRQAGPEADGLTGRNGFLAGARKGGQQERPPIENLSHLTRCNHLHRNPEQFRLRRWRRRIVPSGSGLPGKKAVYIPFS